MIVSCWRDVRLGEPVAGVSRRRAASETPERFPADMGDNDRRWIPSLLAKEQGQ